MINNKTKYVPHKYNTFINYIYINIITITNINTHTYNNWDYKGSYSYKFGIYMCVCVCMCVCLYVCAVCTHKYILLFVLIFSIYILSYMYNSKITMFI